MGTVILMAVLAIEVAFAAYCFVTKSSQERVRNLVRIGAFATFLALTLTSVIEWSFRWYGLAALLFVWFALGARALIQKKGEGGKRGAGRIALRAIATLAIITVALTPALIFPQHRSPKVTGAHDVATVSYTYTDESRIESFTNTGEKRKVNVEFWYPKDANERYPLVVFSHGAFGVKTSNVSTFMELASNGYVVCSIDHPYHSMYTKGADGKAIVVDGTFLQEVSDANKDIYDDATELKINQKWMKLRTADVDAVLDTIAERAGGAGQDEVYRRIDVTKVGLIGHSLGGAASVQVGREHKGIGAVINLDGDLLGEYRANGDGKIVVNDDVYLVPLLSIYSDDMTQLWDGIADQENAIAGRHIAATAPAAFEIHIAGTEHMSLTDVPLISPFLVTLIGNPKGIVHQYRADEYKVIETMNARVLEFFDFYLKGKGTFTAAGTY